MKFVIIKGGLFCLILLISCGNFRNKEKDCLPASILIVSLEEGSKAPYSLVIKTNSSDTSYLRFVGGGKEKFDKYGIDVSENHLKTSIINLEQYKTLKKYIVENNTRQDRNLHNATRNAIKIIFLDRCDFIMYTTDELNTGYFSRMIDTIDLTHDVELSKNLKYFQQLQEWISK